MSSFNTREKQATVSDCINNCH